MICGWDSRYQRARVFFVLSEIVTPSHMKRIYIIYHIMSGLVHIVIAGLLF